MQSWLNIPENSDFTLYNLPYGIFVRDDKARAGVAIGDFIIDLSVSYQLGIFDELKLETNPFDHESLNPFINCGKDIWKKTRAMLLKELGNKEATLCTYRDKILVPRKEARMLVPVQIGDYTDFYSSMEHAGNIGKMFRPDAEPLLPNWKHLPVGYHGRSSSIVISGTGIKRPFGQIMPPGADKPVFGPSQRLDIELEMAYVIGKSSDLGTTVKIKDAEDYIFGKLIFNDWSARDIQRWEYVPLGPFLGKNFGSSISPWIVTMEALEPFRCDQVEQDVEVLPYLKGRKDASFDIKLEVVLTTAGGVSTLISQSNFKYLYWSMQQQLAHHTSNGCNLKVGDLMASGTISGRDKSSYGSLMELSWGGKEPVQLNDGSSRTFLLDGDTISIKAFCEKGELRIGFGECTGTILANPEY